MSRLARVQFTVGYAAILLAISSAILALVIAMLSSSSEPSCESAKSMRATQARRRRWPRSTTPSRTELTRR